MINALGLKRVSILIGLVLCCFAVYTHGNSQEQILEAMKSDLELLSQSVSKRQDVLETMPDDPQILISSQDAFERYRRDAALYQNNPQAVTDLLNSIRQQVGVDKVHYHLSDAKKGADNIKATSVTLSFKGADLSVGRRFVSLLRQNFKIPLRLNYYSWDHMDAEQGRNAVLYRIEFDWIEMPSFNQVQ